MTTRNSFLSSVKTSVVMIAALLFVALGAILVQEGGNIGNSFHLVQKVWACTWVTTNNGSGCSDNKDLYVDHGNGVEIKSVSGQGTNKDSDAKALSVAPPTVTQYIDKSKISDSDKETAKQEVANGNGSTNNKNPDGTPNLNGQTISASTITTNKTPNIKEGDIFQSVGQTPITAVGPINPDGSFNLVDVDPSGKPIVLASGTAEGINPLFAGGNCPNNQVTAQVCRGKQAGSVVSGGTCVATPNGCGAFNASDLAKLQGVNGVYGYLTSPNQATNLGSCRQVLTCSCGGGVVKQQCSSTDPINGATFSNSTASSQCAKYTCPAVGTAGKICEPGSVQCTAGTKGKVCNNTGTGYGGEVEAHACGSTKIYVPSADSSSYCGNGAGASCFTGSSAQKECEKRYPGNCIKGNSILSGAAALVELQKNCKKNSGKSVFTGCGSGGTNCFQGCTADGQKMTKAACVSQPGLSCGSKETTPSTPVTPVIPPGDTTPPASSPPNDNHTPSPSTPVCKGIAKDIAVPKLGDKVTFTCSDVNLAQRYDFRSAYTTTNTVADSDYQTLARLSSDPENKVSLTFDKVGRYVVQCRPCFANNKCDDWETATLQSTN